MTARCVAQVSEPPGYWHSHTCGKPAKGEREGQPVCGIHLRARSFYSLPASSGTDRGEGTQP